MGSRCGRFSNLAIFASLLGPPCIESECKDAAGRRLTYPGPRGAEIAIGGDLVAHATKDVRRKERRQHACPGAPGVAVLRGIGGIDAEPG